ncbi:hypothetical protein [Conexibacter sp. DBS9H8]|uniref:hypothetical protein n=1 Tax=Conexibacter sp. DBS9H8 TaxID=2937801 RepID=UPI00200C5D0E|nr:hypothetical protein [Conexibacter sp. DBS9H8]
MSAADKARPPRVHAGVRVALVRAQRHVAAAGVLLIGLLIPFCTASGAVAQARPVSPMVAQAHSDRPPTVRRARPVSPTPAEVRRAVARAAHSRTVWATLTTCDLHHDRTVGIRGEMPALPFPARLLMVVTVLEFSPSAHRYLPLAEHWKLGGRVATHGVLVQDGLTLRFAGPVTLTARIRFEWFRDGRLLGATSRLSRGGHPTAVSRPRRFSVGACSLR